MGASSEVSVLGVCEVSVLGRVKCVCVMWREECVLRM